MTTPFTSASNYYDASSNTKFRETISGPETTLPEVFSM